MPAEPRVFLSYARADGEAFAQALRERLQREQPEITLWPDRTQLEGGKGWWQQIEEALDRVQFMVLVMTPAALRSPVVRKEWRFARQRGVCVYPVKGVPDTDLDFAGMPLWMRKAQFFDLDQEWQTFVNYLKSPRRAARVPFMAPDLPEGFVERPREFGQLLGHLLDADRQNPMPITTALHGAGGFGKTTLAAALCHHDDIMTAFDDGILWVRLGERPDVREGLTKLYAALTGARPGFVDAEDAAVHLSEKLKDKNCLLVIDDVWDAAHLRPFLRGGKGCARLITTRNFAVAADARPVTVDEMDASEGVRLLTARLPGALADLVPFRQLAQRLGEWPLMLELAGAALRQRLARGDDLARALRYVNRSLDRKGATAFDQQNAAARDPAVGPTIKVSLGLLTAAGRVQCAALAIFPEDNAIPLSAVGALHGLDEFETEELVQHLADLSLLRFDLQAGTIRMHDVMRSYLAGQLAAPAVWHAWLVDGWGDRHAPPDAYAWRWLGFHLMKAGRREELRALLLNCAWLRAKLTAAGVTALIGDYDLLPEEADLRRVQGALRLSAHVLAREPGQLPAQLTGRLRADPSAEIARLLEGIWNYLWGPWLCPLTESLTPPGGPLLRTLAGHGGVVTAVAATPDGRSLVSGSYDGTVKVWDLASGAQRLSQAMHGDWVLAVTVTPDGRLLVSGSSDGAIRVWDLASGTVIARFEADGEIWACAVSPGGRTVVAGDHSGRIHFLRREGF